MNLVDIVLSVIALAATLILAVGSYILQKDKERHNVH